MSVIYLLRIGDVEGRVLDELRAGLSAEWPARCKILPSVLDPEFAFHPERRQFHSTEILARMRNLLQIGRAHV